MNMYFRLFLFCLILSTTVSCGVAENIGENCGGELKGLCHAVFGGARDNNQDDELDDHQDQIDAIKQRISILEGQNSALLAMINTNTNDIALINSLIPTLANQVDVDLLEARVDSLESQIGTPVTGLQSIVTQNTVEIFQLQNNHNIAKVVDPCGNGLGFDEVFLKTNKNKIIASFSDNASGLNTRFSEIPVGGPYNTTDGTGCSFTVVLVGGEITVVSTPPAEEY
jgi:hypothetical protein